MIDLDDVIVMTHSLWGNNSRFEDLPIEQFTEIDVNIFPDWFSDGCSHFF